MILSLGPKVDIHVYVHMYIYIYIYVGMNRTCFGLFAVPGRRD